MGIIGALVSLLRAVPVLERLLTKLTSAAREQKATKRHDEKLAHIDDAVDAAIDAAHGGGLLHTEETEWNQGVDRSPTIPEGRTIRATVDEGGTAKGG